MIWRYRAPRAVRFGLPVMPAQNSGAAVTISMPSGKTIAFRLSASEYSAKCPGQEKPCILPVPFSQNRLWTWHPSHSSIYVSLRSGGLGIRTGRFLTASVAATKAAHWITNLEVLDVFPVGNHMTCIFVADGYSIGRRDLCSVAPEQHLYVKD